MHHTHIEHSPVQQYHSHVHYTPPKNLHNHSFAHHSEARDVYDHDQHHSYVHHSPARDVYSHSRHYTPPRATNIHRVTYQQPETVQMQHTESYNRGHAEEYKYATSTYHTHQNDYN